MPYRKEALKHDISEIIIHAPWQVVREKARALLLSYQVFPERILTGYGEWQEANRTMHVGDTMAQQVFIPPIPALSLKLIFGVRINNVISSDTLVEFSYETLVGHAEKGMSAFRVEQVDENTCRFQIETWSDAGNLLSSLGKYIFTLPYQAYCKRAAMNRIKKELEAI